MNEATVEGTEAADKPAGSVEVFGQEVLGVDDLRAMHKQISSAIHERDPVKQPEGMFSGVTDLAMLKQAGVRIALAEEVRDKAKAALPDVAGEPQLLGRYLHALKYLGVIDNESIGPHYKEELQSQVQVKLDSVSAAPPGEVQDEAIEKLSQLSLHMKALGMNIPDGVRPVMLDQIRSATEVVDSWADDNIREQQLFFAVKRLAQIQQLTFPLDRTDQVLLQESREQLRPAVETHLADFQSAGDWEKYARLRSLYNLYRSGDDALRLRMRVDVNVRDALVEHVNVVKRGRDIKTIASYISHLKHIEQSEPVVEEEKVREVPPTINQERGLGIPREGYQRVGDVLPDNSPEFREFAQLVGEAARRGRIGVNASWPGGSLLGKELQPSLHTVADPRSWENGRGNRTLAATDKGVSQESRQQFGLDSSPMSFMAGNNINEVVTLSDPGEGYSLEAFTAQPRDRSEKVLALSYLVVPTEDRNLSEASGRGSSFYARMFLPAETARKVHQYIQKDPKRIRFLLRAFEEEISGYVASKAPTEIAPQWLNTLHFPTSEARVLVLPEQQKEAAYIREGGQKKKVNEAYVKVVQY